MKNKENSANNYKKKNADEKLERSARIEKSLKKKENGGIVKDITIISVLEILERNIMQKMMKSIVMTMMMIIEEDPNIIINIKRENNTLLKIPMKDILEEEKHKMASKKIPEKVESLFIIKRRNLSLKKLKKKIKTKNPKRMKNKLKMSNK